MESTEPTTDEYRAAYIASALRRHGVSLQTVLTTPLLRITLRHAAIAQRNKTQQKNGEACTATAGKKLRE